MAPQTSKANYKTYEAQARMLRAVVAAHPEVKWNYKEIAACYGSDMTPVALNHRFRRLRAQSVIIRTGRDQGFDMKDLDLEKDLPITQEGVDRKNIARYFGQSTADGIQFQFRAIKKDAENLRAVEKKGGDVAKCLTIGSGSGPLSTPSKPTPARPSGSRSGTGVKRQRASVIKRASSDEDDEDDDGGVDNWSEHDTPSKRSKCEAIPVQKNGTPSRRAAAKAAVTIADATAQLYSSESAEEVETPASSGPVAPSQAAPVAMPSIFGNVDHKPPTHGLDSGGFHNSAFNDSGLDPFLGSDHFANTGFYTGAGNELDQFEI